MKHILTAMLLTLSVNAFAFEQTAILDFSNLYGNTNAGIYEMKAEFIEKTTPSESSLTFHVRQDDGYFTCSTSANFEIGEMSFTLKNLVNGKETNVRNKIFASVGKDVEGQECDKDITDLAGTKTIYSQIGPKEPIRLDVAAPFDFKTVGVYLSPFNGYLNLIAETKIKGDKLVINPKGLLTEKSILENNTQNDSVTYYVFAAKDASMLSLGTGLIKFSR